MCLQSIHRVISIVQDWKKTCYTRRVPLIRIIIFWIVIQAMNQIYESYHCYWQSCFFFGHMNYYSWNLSWMTLFHHNHSLMKTALSRTSGRHLVLDYIFPQSEVSFPFAQTVVSQEVLAADLLFLQWCHYSLQHLTSIPESRTIQRVTIKFTEARVIVGPKLPLIFLRFLNKQITPFLANHGWTKQ